ncbi:MAG: hypothetical protein HKN44_13615 [Ilumatobacter sp.]|nr:hypothetical protein [Ilumatobacter sp.]
MSDASRSLGDKLRGLDLDPPEVVALAAILLRARDAEPEVTGFGFDVGSLGFGPRTTDGFKNSDGILRGDRNFKGSDEELQAIVHWLGER